MLFIINLSTNLMSTSYKKERNKSYYSNCFIPKNDLCIQYKIVEIKEKIQTILDTIILMFCKERKKHVHCSFYIFVF